MKDDLVVLADYARRPPDAAPEAGRPSVARLNWNLVGRMLQKESPFVLDRRRGGDPQVLAVNSAPKFGFHLGQLDYLNLDGLVLLICVLEVFREHDSLPRLVLPTGSNEQYAHLADSGFLAVARQLARVEEPFRAKEGTDVDLLSNFGRPFVLRARNMSEVSGLQDRVDRYLLSSQFLGRLGLDATSEDGAWAGRVARAFHEMLRNIVEWSEASSATVAIESIPRTLVRVLVAETGIGVLQTIESDGCPFEDCDMLTWALLYRHVHKHRPGLFTIAETVQRWGGELWLRSGEREINLKFDRSGSKADLVSVIRQTRVKSVPFIPGVQLRADFFIPQMLGRSTR